MANIPRKKASRVKAQKSAGSDLDTARETRKATAIPTEHTKETVAHSSQIPFGMNMPPMPMGQPGVRMNGSGQIPVTPPMPSGGLSLPTENANLAESLGTMIRLGIDTINAALAGGNQLLQGISGVGHPCNHYPHRYHGYEQHGYMHPYDHHNQHHCCQHNHYHDSYGHSCCDLYGDNRCSPGVHNCCK